MEYPNPLNLTVRGLKTWATDDGGGYQCTLEREDGGAIAFVHNDGNGGCLSVRACADLRILNELEALVKTLPADTSFGEPLPISLDMYIDALVSDVETRKKFDAAIKRDKKAGKFPFALKSDEPFSRRFIKVGAHSDAAVRAFLDKKYPSQWVAL